MMPEAPVTPQRLSCPTFFSSEVAQQDVVAAMLRAQEMAQSLLRPDLRPDLRLDLLPELRPELLPSTANRAPADPVVERLHWAPMAEAYVWNGVPMAYRHFLPTQSAYTTAQHLQRIWPGLSDLALVGRNAVLSGVDTFTHVAATWSTQNASAGVSGSVSTINLSRSNLNTGPPKWLPPGTQTHSHMLFLTSSDAGFEAQGVWQVPRHPAALLEQLRLHFLAAGWRVSTDPHSAWSRGECRVRFNVQGAQDATRSWLIGFSGSAS